MRHSFCVCHFSLFVLLFAPLNVHFIKSIIVLLLNSSFCWICLSVFLYLTFSFICPPYSAPHCEYYSCSSVLLFESFTFVLSFCFVFVCGLSESQRLCIYNFSLFISVFVNVIEFVKHESSRFEFIEKRCSTDFLLNQPPF